MRHKTSLTLLTYWNTQRGNRPAPARAQIEPAAIGPLLPHVFIAERRDGEIGFRLAGTAICTLAGRELKETAFPDLWLPEARRFALRTAHAVADGTPAVLALDGLTEAGRVLHAEALLLPLYGPSGALDRLFGSFSVIDPPYWIGHDPLAGFSTTGIRFLDMARETPFLSNRPPVALPETGLDRRVGSAARRHVAHLTVIDGGRSE